MKKAIIVVSILILVLASMIVYEAMNVNRVEDFKITMIDSAPCNLHKEDCTVTVPKLGEAIFKLNPKPINMNKSLKMEVETKFDDDVDVWVDFLGIEMEMGFNRTKLKAIDQNYRAEGFLPTCTQKEMTWKTTLLIKKGEDTFGYEYKFITKQEDEE